jgi:hypothetical protein
MEELCKLFGKSRQAYYERCNYRISQDAEEDEIMRIARERRKDFPRTGAKNLLIHMKPPLSALGVRIGRDAFTDLLSPAAQCW